MSVSGRVEIAGGGIGGLACAIALAQKGFAVRVHERRAELRDEGGVLSLAENASRALDVLGLSDEVYSGGIPFAAARVE